MKQHPPWKHDKIGNTWYFRVDGSVTSVHQEYPGCWLCSRCGQSEFESATAAKWHVDGGCQKMAGIGSL
jgi:hypothetical protein